MALLTPSFTGDRFVGGWDKTRFTLLHPPGDSEGYWDSIRRQGVPAGQEGSQGGRGL